MTRTALWLLASALAAGLIAAGCGGDDDDGGGGEQTAAGGTPTKDEFIARGEEICTRAADEIREQASGVLSGGRATPERIRSFIADTFVPAVRKRIDQLRRLRPPEGDEARVDAIFDAFDDALDRLAADPSALAGGERPFAEANRMAGEYGFSACAGRV